MEMKWIIRKLAFMAICMCLLILCSCSYESKVVGTWQGNGYLDVLGLNAPTTQLVFHEDGTLVITTTENELECRYSMSDDTLTLNGEEVSWGVPYAIKGNKLSIKSHGSESTFTQVD